MLKNLVKENKDRAVEKNGACRFCGQIKLVEALEEFNEDELNELATEQCNCYESQNYTSRLYRKKRQTAELKSFSGQEISRSLQMQGCRCFIKQQAM